MLLRFRIAALLLAASLLAAGCQGEAVDAQPARVVREFIERMQRVHGDPRAARAAYDLLWAEAKFNLGERAKRASALSGRKIAPEDMLAPSRFSLRFTPVKYDAEVSGDWAVVTVTGESPGQRHQIKCAREDGAWRVVLEVPPLPPIQRRADGGP
jgi:hypothetical protein